MSVAASAATRTLDSVGDVAASAWNALRPAGSPFLRHEWLYALETSGSACEATGWTPRHLALEDSAGRLLAAMPLYLKDHSWGEFVFDHAWAHAYERSGREYYPKLVSCVPFTPITGPRILTADGVDPLWASARLIEAAQADAAAERASSLHILFPPPETSAGLESLGLMRRTDCQYHWRNDGYDSFDDFLSRFRSDRRKKVRRERRRVQEAGIRFRTLAGTEIEPQLLHQVYRMHAATFLERGQSPYLTRRFFEQLHRTMPESLVLTLALNEGVPVACAICLQDETTLYGRYWGCSERYHSLHFETCLYRGIDYCIDHGLTYFEPGAQGEHKLRRGFEPTLTCSAHWLRDPAFAAAVDDYLTRERRWLQTYLQQARDQLPFHRGQQPEGGPPT
ncbi:MAG: GNAT family N-acetyltransferase [Gammaproteobacteria bacterium]|jgi:hypothetical protein